MIVFLIIFFHSVYYIIHTYGVKYFASAIRFVCSAIERKRVKMHVIWIFVDRSLFSGGTCTRRIRLTRRASATRLPRRYTSRQISVSERIIYHVYRLNIVRMPRTIILSSRRGVHAHGARGAIIVIYLRFVRRRIFRSSVLSYERPSPVRYKIYRYALYMSIITATFSSGDGAV